ncbi:hypothetical protein OEZ85_002367 [Tetradesmus obliquus]|uniref:non-specific serine/threonine protein kinase n=1 Tax=Tetradesmus obliquus TaxID=3088 RepID=A0ABY8U5M1_TETOB|nr:hypothetical protein OEZ85_002367 [Tetradesmus obliquus]
MAQPGVQPKFKVLKALGKGSYGTVYKVQRLADGEVYAMKETDLGRMGPKERADAVNEIRVLGSMGHPNVVRHHETFLAGNKLCIVMEYAPAGDLASFIKAAAASKLPLPEATVWQIFLQLCQGMQAIHETCVIHRDIKPANIFMCPDNVVKVGDLGVAKALNKAHYAQTTIGTPVFMAPEVWRGLRYGYSSDLWSLGGVLYEMMTYRLPFEARSLNELKNKIILGSFAPLRPGQPYSAGLVAVCHALLNKDPRRRPTCAAILNSSEAAPWLHAIPDAVRCPLPPLDAVPSMAEMSPAPAGGAAQLLPTIHVPRDIRLLPHHLPKPSYGSSSDKPLLAQEHSGISGYLPSSGSSSAAQQPAPAAAAMAAAMQAAADRAAARGGLARGGSGGAALGSPYLQAPVAGRRQQLPSDASRISPRAPSPRLAAAGAAAASPAHPAAAGGLRPPYGNYNNIYPGAGGAAAAAAGRGASPYGNGVAPSVLGRLQAAKAVAAAAAARVPSSRGAAGGVPSSGRGGVPPRTPPGGFVSPAQQMAAVMAQKQAAGLAAAGRVPSARSRAAGIGIGAGAGAAAGGQGGGLLGARAAGDLAAAGARPAAVRRGFY